MTYRKIFDEGTFWILLLIILVLSFLVGGRRSYVIEDYKYYYGVVLFVSLGLTWLFSILFKEKRFFPLFFNCIGLYLYLLLMFPYVARSVNLSKREDIVVVKTRIPIQEHGQTYRYAVEIKSSGKTLVFHDRKGEYIVGGEYPVVLQEGLASMLWLQNSPDLD